MSRKSTLGPGWLVSMLAQWAVWSMKSEDNGLGYPARSVFLNILPMGSSTEHDSFYDYAPSELAKISEVLIELRRERHELFAAILMYYKPWRRDGLIEMGYPSGNSTFYKRLHDAHELLAQKLCRIERKEYVGEII